MAYHSLVDLDCEELDVDLNATLSLTNSKTYWQQVKIEKEMESLREENNTLLGENKTLKDKVIELEGRTIELEEEIARLQLITNVTARRKNSTQTTSSLGLEERVGRMEKQLAEFFSNQGSDRLATGAVQATQDDPTSAKEKNTKAAKKRKKNRRKKKEAEEGTAADEDRVKVTVWGDSMIRGLPIKSPSLALTERCFPGATLSSLDSKVSGSGLDEASKVVFVHAGTNSLQAGTFGNVANEQMVLRDAGKLLRSLREHHPAARLVVSGIIFRRRYLDDAVNRVNEGLEKLTATISNVRFVDPNPWLGADSLEKDGLHLNLGGKKKLADLFLRIALSPK